MPDDTFVAYRSAGSTRPDLEAAPPVEEAPPSELAAWLRSATARQYEGFWVLLNEQLNVVDSDLSPTALKRRYPDDDESSQLVYIEPRDHIEY